MTETPADKIPSSADTDVIRDALREVMDPELGMNVVELGLIRDIQIQPDSATVWMILTTPFCPYGPAMLESVRTTAEKIASVPTTVEMGTELWTPEMMEEGAGGDWGLF